MKIGDYRPSDLLRGSEIPDEMLRALPKTELHCHLDGSLRLGTFMELAAAAGLDVPADPEAVRAKFFPAERECVTQEFLDHFDHTLAALQTAPALIRAARELAEDCARDGVWRLEARFCPLFHTSGGLTPDQAIAAVRQGLDEAVATNPLTADIILTSVRTRDKADSMAIARLSVDWKGRGVVGFDLAGDEKDNPPKRHREAFYHVMNSNQNITVHAGEGYGADSIHQALHHCGANRIGHGTRLHEDPDLLAYVTDNRIPLEICLSSNLQSCVVDDLARHPFRYYMQKGVRLCLNTDNTLFAGTSPLRELRLAVDTFDLTLLETENLLLNGFKSAFLPEKRKGAMVLEVLATFAVLRDRYQLDALKEGTS